MASRMYCSDVASELKCVSEKLHRLATEIDHIPSLNKYRLYPQIQGLSIIITELDDHLGDLGASCDTIIERPSTRGSRDSEMPISMKFNKSQNERFDYDFGG